MKRILVLLAMLIAINANAQWQPDVRLTNDTAHSYTTFNNAWCVATSGSVVHVVWFDDRSGNFEIYYKRSTNEGLSWGNDVRLTNNAAESRFPSLTISGSYLHIVWQDNRDGNNEIYYKRSTDDGINWQEDTRLTNNIDNSKNPSIAVSGLIVHVVWDDNRDWNDEIYYKRSTNAGVTWETDIRLTNSIADSWDPSVAVSGNVVHVVWYDNGIEHKDIGYKNSTNAGANWGNDVSISDSTASAWYPSIAVSGSVVYVVCHELRNAHYEINYIRSTNGGLSWGSDTQLTNNIASPSSPSVTATGSFVHVVWCETRNGFNDIYYKRSTDTGINWFTETKLTNNTTSAGNPSIALSSTVVHIVWFDSRSGNSEIYYKRNPTGNVGIQNISTETPSKYSLSQNYPNPFNSTSNLKFEISNTGDVKLIVYDIMGKEVQTLVNERLQPGTYEAAFDGSVLNSGVYIYKLMTDGFTETKKMLLIK